MVRFIIKTFDMSPSGDATHTKFETLDINVPELEDLLKKKIAEVAGVELIESKGHVA